MYYIYSGFNMSMYNAADNISEIRCKGTAFSTISCPKIRQSEKNYFFSISYTWARDMPKISDVRSATCGQARMT